MDNILAILPSQQDIFYLEKICGEDYKIIVVNDNGWNSYEASLSSFDPIQLTNRCIKIVKENNVKGIFYSDDFANFIASIVAAETALIAPPSESMFLANNKYYARGVEEKPVEYFNVDINSNEWENVIDFPLHIKPTSLYFSLLQATVNNKRELLKHVTLMREHLPDFEAPFSKLFSEYVSEKKYPLIKKNIALCEELILAKSQHAIEGWTDKNGKHHLWAISDNNYSKHGWLDNNSYPSRLSIGVQKELVIKAFDYANRIGIVNGFWNIEVWIMDDGSLNITEINGRLCASMTPLYENIAGESQYPGLLKISLGEDFEHDGITPQKNRIGAMFSITTKNSGIVSELINIKELEKSKDMQGVIKTKIMYPNDLYVNWVQYGGVNCLARVWIVGENHEEICKKAEVIRSKVLGGGK